MSYRMLAAGCATCLLVVPRAASAHFYIDYPDASYYPGPSPIPWWQEDALGSPQKLGPCGDEDVAADAGGGPTFAVTPYAPGQTITLQWTETVLACRLVSHRARRRPKRLRRPSRPGGLERQLRRRRDRESPGGAGAG